MKPITSEEKAIERAPEVVKDEVEDWEYQGERVAEWETPVIVGSNLTRVGEKQVYILKGYVYVTASDNWAAGWRMEAPMPGIILFVVELDPESGKVLAVERVERDWELNFCPSADEFDREWNKTRGKKARSEKP